MIEMLGDTNKYGTDETKDGDTEGQTDRDEKNKGKQLRTAKNVSC